MVKHELTIAYDGRTMAYDDHRRAYDGRTMAYDDLRQLTMVKHELTMGRLTMVVRWP